MKTGVVLMMDALGFKGIWAQHDGDAVLAKMQRMLDAANETIAIWDGALQTPRVARNAMHDLIPKATFLSDGIVVTSAAEREESRPELAHRVRSVCGFA